MQDWLNKILKWADHNRYTLLGVVVATVGVWSLFSLAGCESVTTGLIGEAPVTRQVLDQQVILTEKTLTLERLEVERAVDAFNASVEAHNSKVLLAYDDLDRQDEFRAKLLETVGTVAVDVAAGSVNPAALIPIAIGLFGMIGGAGVVADNRRKDSVIKKIRTSDVPETATG